MATAQECEVNPPAQTTLTLLLEAHPVGGLGHPDTVDGLQRTVGRSTAVGLAHT